MASPLAETLARLALRLAARREAGSVGEARPDGVLGEMQKPAETTAGKTEVRRGDGDSQSG